MTFPYLLRHAPALRHHIPYLICDPPLTKPLQMPPLLIIPYHPKHNRPEQVEEPHKQHVQHRKHRPLQSFILSC